MGAGIPVKNGAVLITGGGSGIGAACALEFLRRGRDVVIVGRTASRLKTVKGALALAGDVGDEGFARRAFAAARRRFGAVDILVNNAALLVKKGFLDTTAAEWDAVMRTNLRGPFLFSREFLRAPGRAIVNIGSLGGVQGTEVPRLSAYTVGKYGIWPDRGSPSRRALGVAVFCVAPGAVDTAMLRKRRRAQGGAVPGHRRSRTSRSARRTLSGAVIPLDTNR